MFSVTISLQVSRGRGKKLKKSTLNTRGCTLFGTIERESIYVSMIPKREIVHKHLGCAHISGKITLCEGMRILPTGHKHFRCKDIRIYLGSEFYGGSVGEVGLSVRFRTSDLRAVGLLSDFAKDVL